MIQILFKNSGGVLEERHASSSEAAVVMLRDMLEDISDLYDGDSFEITDLTSKE